VWAGPIARYTSRAAAEMLDPQVYVHAVQSVIGGAH